jgi:hypothetical protein
MRRRVRNEPTGCDDDPKAPPPLGPHYQWGVGLIIPILFLAGGVRAILFREAVYGKPHLWLHGGNAIAMGVVSISVALLLHCHYFWDEIYEDAWFAVLGKVLALCGLIGGLGTVIIRVGVLGINH